MYPDLVEFGNQCSDHRMELHGQFADSFYFSTIRSQSTADFAPQVELSSLIHSLNQRLECC